MFAVIIMAVENTRVTQLQELAFSRSSRRPTSPDTQPTLVRPNQKKKISFCLNAASPFLRRWRKGPGPSRWRLLENTLIHLGPSGEAWLGELSLWAQHDCRWSPGVCTWGDCVCSLSGDPASAGALWMEKGCAHLGEDNCQVQTDSTGYRAETWSLPHLLSGKMAKVFQKQMLQDIWSIYWGILKKASCWFF